VPDATFATPDVTTFCRLDELGLVASGHNYTLIREEPVYRRVCAGTCEPSSGGAPLRPPCGEEASRLETLSRRA